MYVLATLSVQDYITFVNSNYVGSYPVSINRDVSPLGNHDVTISVQDDEGFQADKTIPYFLAEDSKPTG